MSPDGSRLAFVSDRAGNDDLWVSRRDGTGARRLTSDPHADRDPSWSPDGTKIVFTSARSGNGDLYVVAAAGGTARQITSGREVDRRPSWSPRGDVIAYQYSYDDLFTVRPDGSDVRRVATGTQPAFSPDGTRLAFVVATGSTGEGDLTVANADGSGARTLMHVVDNGAGDVVATPMWSPDGKELVVAVSGNVVTIPLDGTAGTKVTTSGRDTNPTFAPDGTILFSRVHTADGIYAVRGGGAPRLLFRGSADEVDVSRRGAIAFKVYRPLHHGTVYRVAVLRGGRAHVVALGSEPRWSPDGRSIAFTAVRGISVLDVASRRLRRVTRGRFDYDPAWSPDGRRIAFARGGADLWVVDADGRHARRLRRGFQNDMIQGLDWSPDGRSLALSRGFLEDSSIQIVDPRDGSVRRAWSRGSDVEPRWTRDGRQLVFASYQFIQGTPYESTTQIHAEVFVARADGTHVRRISPTTANNEWPAVLP